MFCVIISKGLSSYSIGTRQDKIWSSITWPAMACSSPMSKLFVIPGGPGDAGLLMCMDSGPGTRRHCKIAPGLLATGETAASKTLWRLRHVRWMGSLGLFAPPWKYLIGTLFTVSPLQPWLSYLLEIDPVCLGSRSGLRELQLKWGRVYLEK